MATMFVRHHVTDYATWRQVYDGLAPTQKAGGVLAEAVYQAADDPNDLTVTHDFATLDGAHAFAGSSELKQSMAAAGGEGAPSIWFTKRA